MNKPLIVIGGGGHAKVITNALNLQGQRVLGFTDTRECLNVQILDAVYLGSDDVIFSFRTDEILLVNGIGTIGVMSRRRHLFENFRNRGYNFTTVTHPAAVIAPDINLSEGVQVMAGAVIQPGCRIGVDTIINTRAAVDHDCQIGSHVHIAPGVTLSGGVVVEDDVHIGTGATVIQGIHIESNSFIGAGAVVVKHVKAGTKVLGVPAREV